MSTADFDIVGSTSGTSTSRGHDAVHSETLTLRLHAPSTDLRKVQFSLVSKSKGSPDLVWTPGSGQPTQPNGDVTTPMPGSGVHLWIVRCQRNDGKDASGKVVKEWTVERAIAIKTGGGLRKIAPTETTQYEAPDGWTGPVNDLVEAAGAGGAGKTLLGSSEFTTATYQDVAGGYPSHPLDDNPVLITDNAEVMAHPGYTCVSGTSKLRVTVSVNFTPNSAGTTLMVALHNGGNALRVVSGNSGTSGYPIHKEFSYWAASPGASVVFAPTVRMGQVAGSGEFYFNGNNSGRRYGGGMVSFIRIEEWG